MRDRALAAELAVIAEADARRIADGEPPEDYARRVPDFRPLYRERAELVVARVYPDQRRARAEQAARDAGEPARLRELAARLRAI